VNRPAAGSVVIDMRTPLRLLAAAAVFVSAMTHLQMWFDGVRHQHMVGPAFMVNSVAGVVIAVLLVSWRHWIPLFLAAGFGVCTLGAFITSATVGLYGVHDHWEGVRVFLAAGSETLAFTCAVLAARTEGFLSREQLQHRRALQGSDLH
jgi:O-antigen/teichoic acid export membrane protein